MGWHTQAEALTASLWELKFAGLLRGFRSALSQCPWEACLDSDWQAVDEEMLEMRWHFLTT